MRLLSKPPSLRVSALHEEGRAGEGRAFLFEAEIFLRPGGNCDLRKLNDITPVALLMRVRNWKPDQSYSK